MFGSKFFPTDALSWSKENVALVGDNGAAGPASGADTQKKIIEGTVSSIT